MVTKPEPAVDDFDYGRTLCAHCGEPIEQPATGRPRRYCTDACRTAGSRYGDPCPRGPIEGYRRKSCWHPPRRRSYYY